MLKGSGQSNWENYLDHIGLWFIFTACAGISLIVWAFNWVCWLNQCCCCDFLHNPINKRIAWWMSFSFLLGILACCISAFVSVNRFGFALEGAWCAAYRVYYDSLNGTLKTSDPKWEGFSHVKDISDYLYKFYVEVKRKASDPYSYAESYESIIDNLLKEETELVNIFKLNRIKNSLNQLGAFPKTDENGVGPENALDKCVKEDFEKIETEFLDNFDYYAKILRACMKVLAMIYYCLLLIVITAAGVSMMFYACLKRQGYLLLFMKILWNIIRFFMFSFFLYGTAYGIGFLAIRDAVAYIMYVFNDNLYQEIAEIKLVDKGKEFLKLCLDKTGNNNLKTKFDEIYSSSLNDFFTNYRKFNESACFHETAKYNLDKFYEEITKDTSKISKTQFDYLYKEAGNDGGIFGSFDCGFLKNDLNILYTALYDASVESRALAALSLTASFFGAVAVYFYLLVMHHYNNDLFFDSGKSIFKGFNGFGGGYQKKNKNQDPAYKKRKLRAELEITSKNEEQSNYKEYKDVNKNDEED